MGEKEVLLRHDQAGVTTLALNRPERLNALDRELSLALVAAVADLQGDPACRCLLITGSGRAFCAGQDLGRAGEDQLPGDVAGLIRERYAPLVLGLRRLPVPVVAAVNGLATGAGLSLALAADLRICSKDAWFSCGFAQIGLVPDSGATYFLSRLLGPGRAMQLAASGERVPAEEALRLGLVSLVLPAAGFQEAAAEYGRRLAGGPTAALALTKQLLQSAEAGDLRSQLEQEALAQQAASLTGDFREGVAAFRERRRPRFRGR